MDPATRDTLRKAYHLIKAGEPAAARELIKPVLDAERDNIDAWWLAVHAAATPQDRRLALVQVLRLNPDHGPARLMLDRLNAEHPEEIDDLARELPLPAVQRKPPPEPPAARPWRWLWNVVMVLGCLSISFGSLALVAGFFGLAWFDEAVDEVSGALGLGDNLGERGIFGTIKGGPPGAPYDVPITKNQGATLGSDHLNVDVMAEDEAHIYTFHAQRGQEVAALLQFTVAGDARYVMELWDGNNQRLARGVGAEDSGTVTLVYEFQRAGSYALVLIGRPDGPRGDYVLGVDLLE